MQPYIFTIDNFNDKEENYPKLNLDSCDSGYIGRCHSYTSSLILDDDERPKSETENVKLTSSLKSIGNETNQFSDFDLSRLASEV